ncbi:MAG: hypothetical protein O3B41_08165 [Bacteroidetes bacterium]|nr:hypothetical protein [Bacteroidota bacterium]
MQFILDNLSALLVSTAVLLMVLSTQFTAQRSAAEQTIAYVAKKQTLETADTIEREFLLIGDGTDETIVDLTTNVAGNTTSFSFWREDELGADMLVAYTLTEQDSLMVGGEMRQLYRLNRFENGLASGGGSSTLTDFRITLLDMTGAPTVSVPDARLIRVAAVNAYPYGSDSDMYLFRSFWGITVRPMNLE